MNPKRRVDMPGTSPVLRDIVIQAHPHALQRPQAPNAASLRAMQIAVPAAELRDVAARDRKPDGYERGFAEGREAGVQAGHAQAQSQMREALQAETEQGRQEGFAQGRLEGIRNGQEEAEAQAAQDRAKALAQANQTVGGRLDRLDRLLAELVSAGAHRLADAEDDLVALCHLALCRILGDEAASAAGVRSMVRHLVAQHGHKAQLAVHVHPHDLEALMRERQQPASEQDWRWVADDSIQLGGVILRSPEGSLDARLEVQLAALHQALTSVRQERRTTGQTP